MAAGPPPPAVLHQKESLNGVHLRYRCVCKGSRLPPVTPSWRNFLPRFTARASLGAQGPDGILQSPGQRHGAFCFLLKSRTISLSARVVCSAEAALGRLMESRRGISRPLRLPPGRRPPPSTKPGYIFTLLIQSHRPTLGRKRAREVCKGSNGHLHTSVQCCIILK